MSQRWTDLASTSAFDRLGNADNASIHLSDGTHVWLEFNGASLLLKYSSDHVTTVTISTISMNTSGGPYINPNPLSNGPGLCRDASDNLYVVAGYAFGSPNPAPALNEFYICAFTKGSGYTWTRHDSTAGTGDGASGTPTSAAVVWCNTGGGTGGAGHLVIQYPDYQTGGNNGYLASLDAGGLLATYSAVGNGQSLVSSMVLDACYDLDTDGFGATNGIVATGYGTSVKVAAWSVASGGALTLTQLATETSGSNIAYTGASVVPGNKVRVIRAASNLWAVVAASPTAGRYGVARYSSTARLTALTDSGAVSNMPLVSASSGWDVFLDPHLASRLWVIAQTTNAATIYRQPVDVGSGVTWSTAAAVLDDTLSPFVGQESPSAGVYRQHLRAVKKPTRLKVDYETYVETASTPTYALVGNYGLYNSNPNAPVPSSPGNNSTIDRGNAQRFAWSFSDPDVGDAQSAFSLQYRVVSTTPWTTVTGTTPNSFYDFAAGTFAAGNYEWQVQVTDNYGGVSPWSTSNFFTAATAPVGPTISAPTGGSTVATSSGTISWSFPTQSAYRVRKVADNAGSPDTGTIYYDSGEITDPTARSAPLTFPVNNRYEHLQVLVRDSGTGLLSPYSSVRVMVAYTQPATPTLGVTPNSSTGTINVAVTNPTPTGGQPTVTSWDIYRRVVGDGTAGVRLAASITSAFVDRTPASGVAYEYSAVAYGNNTTTASSAWTA